MIKYTIDIVRDMYKDTNIEFIKAEHVFSEKQNKKVRLFLCKCKICGHTWHTNVTNINKGHGCKICANRNINNKNKIPKNGESFGDKNPELIKYLLNKEDAYKYKPYSKSKIIVKCINCGNEFEMQMCDLTNRKNIPCRVCSDGISIPEKYCYNLLSELNINFETQYKPHWSNGKIYDFYIPSLNMIIETHGGQHYLKSNLSKCELIDIQNNDLYKKENAIKNNINYYVEIDCRKSEPEWLEKNFKKSLSKIFNLDKIKMIDIWIKSNNSNIIDVCNLWESGVKSIPEISKILNISKVSISRYLKYGSKLGICYYNPEDESKRASKVLSNKYSKSIDKYDLNGNYICTYKSISEASENNNIPHPSTTQCLNERNKSAKGFIWKYHGDANLSKNLSKSVTGSMRVCRYYNDKLNSEYKSLTQAFKSTGICRDTIQRLCLSNKQDKNGFTWKYAN